MSDITYSDFDFAAYCQGATEDAAKANCNLYSTMSGMAETQDGIVTGVDTFFLLFAGAAVFLMQAGFAMLCAGSVRQKNVKNIMLKNLLDACGGAIGFFTVGYGFAYGGDEDPDKHFIGTTYLGLRDFSGTDYIGWFFQFAFAATAATIVAGTVAERCKMIAYLLYSLVLTGLVYPVVVHAVWSNNGYLTAFRDDAMNEVGVIDFAGSGVVHMTGGATALIAAYVLGPRIGRFHDEDGNLLETPTTFQAHSTALQILGTFILWFGWYGFNPGSALAIANEDSAATASLCAITTTLAAASGCVTSMFTDTFLEMARTGEATYDLTMAMNGALAGLVGITAGTSVISPGGSILVGIVAGWVYLGASKLLITLKIDDAVDAVPVHFANGIWGVIAVGFFAEESLMATAGYSTAHQGIFYSLGDGSFDATLLGNQLVCVAFIIAWVSVTMGPFFLVLKVLGLFRVDALEEEVGLDISHHRGAAYNMSGAAQEHVEELMEIRASKHGKVDIPMEISNEAGEVAA